MKKTLNSPFGQEIKKPWGKEIIITHPQLERVGKIIFVNAGSKLSLQYHDQKEETLVLFSGQAIIWLENDQGKIEKFNMMLKKGYLIRPNQKHRVEAVKDSVIFEVSSPEAGNTFRIEDDYRRGTETEADRNKTRA